MYISREDGMDYLKEWLVSEGYDEEEVENTTVWDNEGYVYHSDLTGKEYKVFGEEEIFSEVYDNVIDKVWTFSPEFIADHAANWNCDLSESLEYAMEKCQWDLSPVIIALIGVEGESEIDDFVTDAISEYGVDEFMDDFYTVYDEDDFIILESDN